MQDNQAPGTYWKPSSLTIWAIFIGLTIVIVVAFVAGYLPNQERRQVIVAEAKEVQQTSPRVETIVVARSNRKSGLTPRSWPELMAISKPGSSISVTGSKPASRSPNSKLSK